MKGDLIGEEYLQAANSFKARELRKSVLLGCSKLPEVFKRHPTEF